MKKKQQQQQQSAHDDVRSGMMIAYIYCKKIYI